MFDDPDKKLRWMEQELLAAEAPEEEELYEEDFLGEFDSELLEALELTEDDLTPGYNYAADYGRTIYADEEPEEDYYEAPPKKKGIGGLVFIALLEILGILVILGWWLQWLV